MAGCDDGKAKAARDGVRPASTLKAEGPKELAVYFICSVTVSSMGDHDWIARNGKFSPYSALYCLLPQVN